MLDEFNLDGEEYSGLWSGDFGTLPELRSNLRAIYNRGPFQASVNWQRIGDVDGPASNGGDSPWRRGTTSICTRVTPSRSATRCRPA